MAAATQGQADEPLPEEVDDTVEAVAELHREHDRHASMLQRAIDAMTGALGRPIAPLVAMALLAVWAAAAAYTADGHIEPPLFGWLELAATIAALLIAMLILVTQRREDELAERRAELTLEMALLADKKSAKIICLLEELRRDHPDIEDRKDAESETLSTAADPGQVAAAIEQRAEDQ